MIMRSAAKELAIPRRTIFISALMIALAAATGALEPARAPPPPAPDLDALLPDAFGGWRRAALPPAILPEEVDPSPGEATAYRAYRDASGRVVTLVVAYGPPLGDSVRLHRPESCYVAQGYAVTARKIEKTVAAGIAVVLVRLSTQGPARAEAVTYWLRSGPEFTADPASAALSGLRRGFKPLDGALVRASSPGADARSFALHTEFLTAFAEALGPKARALLLTGETRPS
jgi:EpsI family protein